MPTGLRMPTSGSIRSMPCWRFISHRDHVGLDSLWIAYGGFIDRECVAFSSSNAGPSPQFSRVHRLVGHTPDSSPYVRHLFLLRGFEAEKGTPWWNGEAIWMALSNTEYQTTDMTWLAWYPWASDIATHVTVLWEMTFWMLVWRPAWRPMTLLVGVCMHLGIGVCLGMWTFGLIMMFTYISFIPPDTLRRVGSWIAAILPRPERKSWIRPAISVVEPSASGWRKTIDLQNRWEVVVVDSSLPASRLITPPIRHSSPLRNGGPRRSNPSPPGRSQLVTDSIFTNHASSSCMGCSTHCVPCKNTSSAKGSIVAPRAVFPRPVPLVRSTHGCPSADESVKPGNRRVFALSRNTATGRCPRSRFSDLVAPKLSSEFLGEPSADHLVVVGSATYGDNCGTKSSGPCRNAPAQRKKPGYWVGCKRTRSRGAASITPGPTRWEPTCNEASAESSRSSKRFSRKVSPSRFNQRSTDTQNSSSAN